MPTSSVVLVAAIRRSGARVGMLVCVLMAVLAACELGEDTRYCLNRPVLTDFEIYPNRVYAGFRADTVRFSVEASDVIGVRVTVESPAGLQESCNADTLLVGMWRCDVVLPESPEYGAWLVMEVFLNDSGVAEFCTGTVVTGTQLENAGYPTAFVVRY